MDRFTITLSKATHRGEQLLLIGFPYNFEAKEYIKKFAGVRWGIELKSFYIPFSRGVTNSLFKYLRERKYYVDYSALKTGLDQYIIEKKVFKERIKITSEPHKDILVRLSNYKKWMAQRRYSDNTIKTYASMILVFFGFHNEKTVDTIKKSDLEDFNTRYILANGFSYTYQNQTINALKLFCTFDGRDQLLSDTLERPKKQTKLPEVLGIDEVKAILGSITNLKHKTLLSLLYACGLRIGETLNIKVNDLDLNRGFTHIKSGKGRKDRYVPIPKKMCTLLNSYIEAYKPSKYLFEGMKGEGYSAVSARQILKRAVKHVGISKAITLHTLRHSHATHLLENGTDIRYIQELLGHNSPKTTMIYTHVSSTSLDRIKNPFDEFDI